MLGRIDMQIKAAEPRQIVCGKLRRVLILGPSLTAVSGISSHLAQILKSDLVTWNKFVHFQVGSEGRAESRASRIFRLMVGPVVLFAQIVRIRPDIVHINTSMNRKAFLRDLGFLIVARLLLRRTVLQVHGGVAPQWLYGPSSPLNVLLRWVLRLPEAIILLAEAERIAYSQFCPGLRLYVIPNAVARVQARRASPEFCALEGRRSILRVVYLGRLIRSKGIFDIVESARILISKGIPIQVTIVGTGDDERNLRALVQATGLNSHVQILGPVFGVAKDEIWRGADVLAFPTYFDEGMPYSLLEGMAAGVVPITCAIAAIPEVIEDGIHGFFVPPRDPGGLADALERLASDRITLCRMSAACRDRVTERYAIEGLVMRLDALYQKLQIIHSVGMI